MGHKPTTAALRNRAVAAYVSGMPMPRVCEKFGVARQTVRQWVLKAGHEMRGNGEVTSTLTSDEQAQFLTRLRSAHASGKSIVELSEEYDTRRTTIRKWLDGTAVPRRKPQVTRLTKTKERPSFRSAAERVKFRAAVQTLHAEGKSKQEIGRRLGYSDATIRRWLSEWATDVKAPATPALVVSARADGRGHWPKGKRRSKLSPAEHEKFLAELRQLLAEGLSRREIARRRGVSEKAVRNWLSGEDLPA